MFDENKGNEEVVQQPVNPYLVKEPVSEPVVEQPVIQPVEQSMQQMAQNAEQGMQQTVQNAEQSMQQMAQGAEQSMQQAAQNAEQNAQFVGQNTAQNMGQAAVPPISGEPNKPKKNTAVAIVIVLAVVALILLIAIVAVVALGSFGNKKKVVTEALAATFEESSDYIEEIWELDQYEGMFEEKDMTVVMDMELSDGTGFDMTIQQNEDACSIAGEASILEMEAYVDDSTIAFAVPSLLDYVFVIDRDTLEDDIWNLVDMDLLDEDTSEELIEMNKRQQDTELSDEAAEQLKEDAAAAWAAFFKKTSVKSGDSKELEYNGKDRDCDGYVLETNYEDIAILLEALLDAVQENSDLMDYLEVSLSGEYGAIDDMEDAFDDIRDSIEELKEDGDQKFFVEFYLYDGKVVQIYCEEDDDVFEWNIEGGEFPLENMDLMMEDDGEILFEIIRTGYMDDDQYRAEYTYIDEYETEYVADIRYTPETGDIEFECLEDGWSLIFIVGNMEKTDDSTISFSIDTLEVDEMEVMSGDIMIQDTCDKIKMPKGEKLEILTLSEDEWYDLEDELYMALMSIYY